jgi:hypothetical protein
VQSLIPRKGIRIFFFYYAKELGMPFILAVFLLLNVAFATVTVGKVNCPIQFEGRVEEFIRGISTGSTFSTHTVVFKNLLTLKGDVKDQVAIEMLEHGPFELEKGTDYRVQLRQGRVCWIEKL